MDADLADLLRRQGTVVTLQQLEQFGIGVGLARTRVESGRWQRLHPGVVVTHSGPLDLVTRCWAAVLAGGPGAVVAGRTAAALDRLRPASGGPIEILVPHERRVDLRGGVVIRRQRIAVTCHGSPPRTPLAATALDLVGRTRDEQTVVALVTDATRILRGPGDLRSELARRRRQRHRPLIKELLGEDAAGIESVLEHRFDREVLLRHGLPRLLRQRMRSVDGHPVRLDGEFAGLPIRVQLDGRVHLDRDQSDVWSDNALAIEHAGCTLRYRWHHVVTPCRTAHQVAAALRATGWSGRLRICSPLCRA